MKKSNIIWVEGHFERTDEKKDELKNRAKEFVSKIASGTPQEMDYYANILVEFANETTKELKEENAELKAYNEKLLDGDIEKHNKIVELETELAKRAEQIEALNKDKDYFSGALDKQIEATYKAVEKLNKAKDLLNEFMRISKASDEDFEHDYSELIAEAETFLKEGE